MSDTVMAWHWVGDRLRDGRAVPKTGRWLRHDGPVVMCESGLHASIDVWDALQYAPGAVLCRVECGGVIKSGDDKIVCSERRIVARKTMTRHLRKYACDEALRVAHLWDIPDVVREYLETQDETIRAAARAATWDAAGAAARDAVWDAAGAAARAAAMAAAWDAAWAAAWAAARAATWDAAADRFRAMVSGVFGMEDDDE